MKLKHTKVATLAATLITFGSLAGGANAVNIVVNYDFEMTTATGTTFNPNNALFTSLLTSVNAFGAREGIDIMTLGSNFGSNPQSGDWKVSLASDSGGSVEALSMDLSTSTIIGESYNLSFHFERLVNGSFDGGIVEVGLSATPTSFGTLVHTTGLATDGWSNELSTFVALISADYLTVRVDNGASRWVSVDNFSLSLVPEPSSALLLVLGGLSLISRRQRT